MPIRSCGQSTSPRARWARSRILVNNAGIPDAQRAHKMSVELVDAVLDTNVRGPWLLACEVARRLIAAERPGRIVNISSMGAFSYTGMGAALYSVTKAAVNRMTEALAVEWARYGINVNGIAPGAFSSEMMDGMISRIGDITKGFPRNDWASRPSSTARCCTWCRRRPSSSPARWSRSTTARANADGPVSDVARRECDHADQISRRKCQSGGTLTTGVVVGVGPLRPRRRA